MAVANQYASLNKLVMAGPRNLHRLVREADVPTLCAWRDDAREAGLENLQQFIQTEINRREK